MKRFLPLILLMVAACDSNHGGLDDAPVAQTILIANGGNFSDQNGSVSRLDLSSSTVSGGPVLDGFVQAVVPAGDGILVLINTFSGGRIDLLDAAGQTTASIPTEASPRAAVVRDGRAYVTAFTFDGSGTVLTVDLTAGTQAGQPLAVGAYPEGIAHINGKLVVANYGFIGDGRTISLVDPVTGSVTEEPVACDGPREVLVIPGADLAVVCQGKTVYNADFTEVLEQTNARVLFLDGSSLAQEDMVTFDSQVGSTGGGEAAAISDTELLVLEGSANQVRRVRLETRGEVSPWTFSIDGSFAGVSGIDHADGRWFIGRMARAAGGAFPDFTASGQVVVLSQEGTVLSEYPVGPAPTHIAVVEEPAT